MSLQQAIHRHLERRLADHLAAGRALAEEAGADGRMPLAPSLRWRFTGQGLLRDTLGADHPLHRRFARHCSYGFLARKRFLIALELFTGGMDEARRERIGARLDEVAGALGRGEVSAAVVALATLLGACPPAIEPPATAVLARRLRDAGWLDAAVAADLAGDDADARAAAAAALRTALTG